MRWLEAIIPSSSCLEDAIKRLNSSALRIALVVDEDKKLLGTVTDGDIRRSMLRHRSMRVSIVEVMNKSPVFVDSSSSRKIAAELMKKNDIYQIPVLDQERRVVDLWGRDQGLLGKIRENPVFIMAGGFGKRLSPLTNNCPKPMLRLGNKPILEHIIESFIAVGFYKFYISTHFLPRVITDYFGDGSKLGVEISYLHEEVPLGTGGALGLLPREEINKPIFIINGDVLTSLDLIQFLDFHDTKDAVATMCVREYEYQIPYGVVGIKGSDLISIVEKPTQKFFINAGVYILEPNLVKSVPANTHLDLPVILQKQLTMGKKVQTFPIYEQWIDVGHLEDFKTAQRQKKLYPNV